MVQGTTKRRSRNDGNGVAGDAVIEGLGLQNNFIFNGRIME